MRQDERTTILFAISSAIGLFTYYELQRRQGLGEKREESRREWVDTQLARLTEGEIAHRERAAGRIGIGRALVAVAGLALAIATIVSLVH